ncbi:MAG: hypothetical protein Q8N60_02780 [Candidatus Diapherotrites archaeon]|nr:hypothetical protein [Candidatus Diapherotrites archaeon]
MGLNGESGYRCILCGSLFSEPHSADRCCARAKGLIFCDMVKGNGWARESDECSLIKAHVLGKNLVVNKIVR